MAKLASKTKKKKHHRDRALPFTLIYCGYIIIFKSTIFSFAQYIINVCLFLVSGGNLVNVQIYLRPPTSKIQQCIFNSASASNTNMTFYTRC
jgi:hypothetical protein